MQLVHLPHDLRSQLDCIVGYQLLLKFRKKALKMGRSDYIKKFIVDKALHYNETFFHEST